MKDVLTYRLYTRVARLGSFSAAAREAGLSQSQVSRMVAELEASLGARLLSRTTRAVVPTEAGREILARMEQILAAIDDAENSVRETGELRGRLRLGMPSTLAIRVVLPRLATFAERHPQLHIEVLLDDACQDLVREAIDVGIRVGRLPDGSGTSKLVGKMRHIAVASPSYLARAGTPKTPGDLDAHRIIFGPVAAQVSAWSFTKNGKTVAITLRPHVSTNDTAGAVAAALGGLGVTLTTTWAIETELAAKTLVRLLPSWEMPELPVHAYFPMGRTTRLPARAFVDFLAAELKKRGPREQF